MITKASSFADLADVDAFERCKAMGKTDKECFRVGDNGIGCWGDKTAQVEVPMCALPPDDIVARWGSIRAKTARGKLVRVQANGRSVIDLNPAAAIALKLKPPFLVTASWEWCEP
jgi:hypothetical protein